MAHSNLGKAAGSLLTATEVNKLWSDDGSDNFETDGTLSIDTISEQTGAAGVTIDSVLLKDGGAVLSGNLDVNSVSLFVDTSSNFVGIGKHNPATNLDIQGADVQDQIVAVRRAGGNIIARIGTGASGDGFCIIEDNTSANKVFLNSNGNTYFTGGNVGIGTSSPSSPLSIDLATEDLDIEDAGSAAATEQDWIEVKVGGNVGYIRVFASK